MSVTIANETSLDVIMATLLMRDNLWIHLNGPSKRTVGDVERIFALAFMLTSFSEHVEGKCQNRNLMTSFLTENLSANVYYEHNDS